MRFLSYSVGIQKSSSVYIRQANTIAQCDDILLSGPGIRIHYTHFLVH